MPSPKQATPTPPEEMPAHVYAIGDLHLFEGNPRQGDVDAIKASLKVHGQYKPVLVNAGTYTKRPDEVLAGNHTVMAMRQLAEEEPNDPRWQHVYAWIGDYDDDQAARIVLIDNRASELGDSDTRLLLELMAEMDDLDGTGYTQDDIDLMAASLDPEEDEHVPDGKTDPDDVPEAPAPTSRVGDVWILGPHRLCVGDSTHADTYAQLMREDKADLVWTDPPYGVSYVGKTAEALTIQNDSMNPEQLSEFLAKAFTCAVGACEPGAIWYVAAPAGPLFHAFGGPLLDLGIWRQTIAWVKDQFVMGRSHMHYRHEAIFYGYRDQEPALPDLDEGNGGMRYRHESIAYGWVPNAAAAHPPEERTHDTVWEVARPKASRDHPTMKPVELIEKALNLSSSRGEVVLDMFGGSGSTLLAAHRTGRVARLIELDPKYADVICRRYEEHTGVVPIRERTGKAHSFVPDAETERTEA